MFKKLARKMLGPVLGPVWRSIRPVIYKRIDWRIYYYLVEHGDIQGGDTSWNKLAPAFLNAVSTVQTFGRELVAAKKQQREDIARLEQEIHALRRELEALKEQSREVVTKA